MKKGTKMFQKIKEHIEKKRIPTKSKNTKIQKRKKWEICNKQKNVKFAKKITKQNFKKCKK